MFRTFPSVANDITIDKEFKLADFGAAGSPTDMIEFTNADVGAKFVIDGCDANVHISDSQVGQIRFSVFLSSSDSVHRTMLNSAVDHSITTNSAIYLHQTNGVFIDVAVTSSAVSSNGPYVLYADFSTDAFLIDVELH